MSTIKLPETTKHRLIQMLQQRDNLQGRIDEVIGTVREVMNVPAHYIISNVDEGFVEPGEIADADDPNHE